MHFRNITADSQIEVFTGEQFEELTQMCDYRFDRDYYSPENKKLRETTLTDLLTHCNQKERGKLITKHAICLAFEELHATGHIKKPKVVSKTICRF